MSERAKAEKALRNFVLSSFMSAPGANYEVASAKADDLLRAAIGPLDDEVARLTRELEEAREREERLRNALSQALRRITIAKIWGGLEGYIWHPLYPSQYRPAIELIEAALAATPPQEASPVSTGGKADDTAHNARRDAGFVRGEMEASE